MKDQKNQPGQERVYDPHLVVASQNHDPANSGISRRGFLGYAAASIFLAGADQQTSRPESRNGIPYRMLGRTGEKVSLVGLGGYHLGKQADPQESILIIRTGLDEGINFLDNCWDYNGGESEIRMGNALRDGYRQKAFLMSKIDGRTKASATSQINDSLRRLQTDRIDLLQFHEVIRDTDADRIFAEGGAMEAVLQAQKAGKIRFIGFTGHKSPDIHLKMLATASKHGFTFDAVQMPLNVMDAHFNSFEKNVNKKENSVSVAGTVSFGEEISVHRLGFGAMRLTGEGIWGPPKDRKGALAVLRRAVELDVNFIDTADSYGPHINEELIAEALFPYPAGLVIATKGGWNRPGPNQWTHDATPTHLRKAVEGSLKRLRLDRIDLYQLHTPDPVVSFEASVETLAQLRNEGKIRLIALSNVTQEHIERARKIVPIVSVQNRYSFADREWDYVVDYCERNEIVFIPWFPLGAGKVAGEVLDRIAKAHRVSPTQVALAWLLRRSPIMLPIPGTSSIAHLEENIAAASLRLTDEDYQMLSAVPELVASR